MRPLDWMERCLALCSVGFFIGAGCCKEGDLPALQRALYSTQAADRNHAALELAKCGSKAQPAVPRLATLLYDPNVGVQSSAAFALRKIDTPEARRAIENALAVRRKRR
jgi:HEAT repeat protein